MLHRCWLELSDIKPFPTAVTKTFVQFALLYVIGDIFEFEWIRKKLTLSDFESSSIGTNLAYNNTERKPLFMGFIRHS